MKQTAYIGLGSNLGDRFHYLQSAVERMHVSCGKVLRVSPVYESAPIGIVDQGLFLNAAAVLETDLSPDALLACLKAIESDLGRRPGPRYGPRVIDLDILVLGDIVQQGPPTIPHPEMHRRSFVMRPLSDLAPDLLVPGQETVTTLLQRLGDTGLTIWRQSLEKWE